MSSLILAIGARIYRDGLATALSLRPGFAISSTQADTAGAIAAAKRDQPDVLLLDTDLGVAHEVVFQVHEASPETKLIALGIRANNGDDLLAWAEAGAAGFVTSDNSVDDLVNCINLALNGELACSPRIAATLLRRLAHLAAVHASHGKAQPCLTPRQTRILQLLRSGQSNKQIARELGIELATVKNHVHHLLRRLKVSRRHEAAASAVPHTTQPHPQGARP